MTSIRTAVPEDIPAIVSMGQEAHAESPNYNREPYEAERVAAFAGLLIQSDGLFMAEAGSEPVGFSAAICFPHFATGVMTGADVMLYVAPAARGTSAAPRLVKAMESWAAGLGAQYFMLCPANGFHHQRTVGLFMRLGYELIGVTMRRSLVKESEETP